MDQQDLQRVRITDALIVAAAALALSGVLIGVVLYVHDTTGVPMGTLTRDPLSGKPAYLGLLSQAGILVWALGAAVALLGARLLPWRAGGGYMLAAAALTTLLCIDDAFLLHDEVLPLLGISEKVIYAIYLVAALSFLVVFARRILKTAYPLFVLAFAFLGVSVVADTVGLPWLDPYLLEDGAKFIGIALWSGYLFHTSGSLLAARPHAG